MRVRLFNLLLLRRGAIIVAAYFAGHVCVLLASVLLILAGFGIETVGNPALWITLGIYVVALVTLPRLRLHALTMFHAYRGGLLHKAKGNCAAAEACLRVALKGAEQCPDDDPCRGEVLLELAAVMRTQGHFDDAEHFGQRALTAQEAAWGTDHPRTTIAREEMAETYRRMARYHLAKSHLERALQTRVMAPGIELARVCKSLGELCSQLEQWTQAEAYLRRAFDFMRQQRGEPGDLALVAAELSRACLHLDRLDEAEALAQSSVHVAEKDPAATLFLAKALTRLANVREAQERYGEAEILLRKAIALVQQLAPTNRLAVHEELHLLGVILRRQSRWAEAEECFRETLQLREEYLAPEDLAIARVSEDYAQLLELMGRTEEAHRHEHRARQVRDFHSPFRIG